MPLDAEKLDELKINLAFARKRPLAFGICLGKSAETTVLVNHKTKDPETVGRQAKKEGETAKLAFGMMTVESKNLNLLCHGDVIPGLARKTKEMLKAAGLKMKVRILDAEGNLLEENGDEEEDDNEGADGGQAQDDDNTVDVGSAADDPAAPEPEPEQEKWLQTRPRIEAAIDRTTANGSINLGAAMAIWDSAVAMADADDFAGAMQAAAATIKQIAATVDAARAAEAERARWGVVAAQLQPVIAALVAGPAPEAKKLAALWSFAQAATVGPLPDFAKAIKAATLVVQLIRQMRANGTGTGTSNSVKAADDPAKRPANGAPPVTADENTRLASLSDEDLAKADLTLGDTKELFSDSYMQRLKDAPIKGEGDPKLKDLLREIEKGLAGPRRAEVMQDLAKIVGDPPTAERLDDDYGRFLVVKKQQEVKGKQKNDATDELDEDMHPEFLGSRSQLMFGKVLGDAFGIHEVFAALLSPTGGLVGPGNWLVNKGPIKVKAGHLSPDNPIALHGTVHDAAGYLETFHDEGPGYNYRNEPMEVLIKHLLGGPMSGQISGINYWIEAAGPDYVVNRTVEAVAALEKQLKSARDAVEAEIDRQIAEAKKLARQAADLAKDAADSVIETARGVAEAILGSKSKVEESAVEALDTAAKKIGEAAGKAKRNLEAAWDFLRN